VSKEKLHSFLTSALDEDDWSTSRLGRFSHRKESRQLNRRLVWPHSQSGGLGEQKKKMSLPGFEPWIIRPVA